MVAAAEDLAAHQPSADWRHVVRRGVARRRTMHAVGGLFAATAIVALAIAVPGPDNGADSLIAAPPSATAEAPSTTLPTASPERSASGVASARPTLAPRASQPGALPATPASSPSPSPSSEASPSAQAPAPVSPTAGSEQPLQSCGIAPPSSSGEVRLTVNFPSVVTGAGAEGTATLTNGSSSAIQVEDREYATADSSRDGRIVSAGSGTADARALVTVEPGQSRTYRVVFPTAGCGSSQALPPGSYAVAAHVLVQGDDVRLVSNYDQVTFETQ